MMKDFLRTADLSPHDLRLLLARSRDLKKEPHRGISILRGETVVLYFEKPSTRTRLSFETAIVRLGGHPIFTGPSELQVARGETIEDTARVASRYARAWVMRAARHGAVDRFAHAATIPVVNALTDRHHPCQAIADLFTMQERFGDLRGRTLAFVGAGNNVSHDLMHAAALAGMHMRVASPRAFGVDPSLAERAEAVARECGGSLELLDDAHAAATGADAIYTDVWSSMTDDPHQAEMRRAAFEPFRVDARLFGLARPDAVFMHCLPCKRGEEVTAEVVDGPRSVVVDQAENRLHTSMAVLECLLQHELTGSKTR